MAIRKISNLQNKTSDHMDITCDEIPAAAERGSSVTKTATTTYTSGPATVAAAISTAAATATIAPPP